MPPSHEELIHNHSGRHASGGTATAAVPWDSDSVAYVGMEYSNKGACSQKRSAAVDFYGGGGTASTGRGCSQNKAAAPAAYLNMNSDGSIRSQPAARLCQAEGCEEPALRIDDRSPGALCQRHLQDGMQRVAHNDRIYGTHR
ncbi:hypothetical protein Esi_0398_0002 [Ectocarpus siliculosus]|uniref:EsV-1-7 n=1 Tax=Ectocarpus siliculosus TaxID=2880 RepID=D7G080_ECTSI|nr:hypothetical protein Esi_0398_0002 [Ectocarpus siliculosus]|eukprot:CBJ32962.1 hypothetical protein Esi_0398_0002 [Ectocarpus siliculosus]